MLKNIHLYWLSCLDYKSDFFKKKPGAFHPPLVLKFHVHKDLAHYRSNCDNFIVITAYISRGNCQLLINSPNSFGRGKKFKIAKLNGYIINWCMKLTDGQKRNKSKSCLNIAYNSYLTGQTLLVQKAKRNFYCYLVSKLPTTPFCFALFSFNKCKSAILPFFHHLKDYPSSSKIGHWPVGKIKWISQPSLFIWFLCGNKKVWDSNLNLNCLSCYKLHCIW